MLSTRENISVAIWMSWLIFIFLTLVSDKLEVFINCAASLLRVNKIPASFLLYT